MKFAKTLQMTANSLPEEYKGQVLNYKKFKKSINKIVDNLESTGVYEIPENEKCKVIYSLSNKDGDDGEIKSSLILYIDKNYAAELSQKDALELNSEEITIDPKLKEVIELSDDASVEQHKVTKERVIKSFQLSDSGKNEYIFNKKLPLKSLARRSNSDEDVEPVTSGVRRNTIVNGSVSNPSGTLKLKRSKSDGDKMQKYAKEKSPIIEEDEDKSNDKIFNEPESTECLVSSSTSSPSPSPYSTLQDIASTSASPELASSSSTNNDSTPVNNTNTNTNTNTNNNVMDNIPELEKSDDVITNKNKINDNINEKNDDEDDVDDVIDCTAEANNPLSDEAAKANTMKSLKVLLDADARFLNELAASLSQLSAFQDEYKKVFETKINIMANILSEVSSPNMKDTYRWRELLAIYCDSNIWKYKGKDRTPDEVIEQLKIFEIKANTLRRKFKTKKSQTLLKEFIQLNYDIVAIKRFYELNQTAIYKILKKHDKRTHLLASEGFPQFARDETFFKDNIVRSLVFQISSRLLKVIPNPAEYFCPICQEISYKPIRLDCGHLFCLRCLLKAKRMNCRDCPLCREKDVIYNANSSHLDTKLMRQLKHDFPKEVKAKLVDSKTEKAKEDSEALLHMYGYGNPNQCIVM
ncbi:hypothetical protein H8356DRAFT_391403 [Neocallimastix lanati (nom. inval.)]|jgi:hypothetical protein|nr:hypothetical protein H8356DRAFT_391403 [Neocallimastix sp. JGI-2020a]